jgi:hypothetical protein
MNREGPNLLSPPNTAGFPEAGVAEKPLSR